MDHHDASKLEPPSSREEPPEWRRAHDDLTQLAKTRAHLDWQEGRSLRSALKTGAHLQLGFASFAEYIERLFGYTARWTAERLRVAEALDRLPEIDQALRDSALNWSAVRELTRVAVPENEHQWLALARGRSLRHSAKISNRRTCVATPGHSAHPAHHHLRLSIPSVAAAKLTPRRGSYWPWALLMRRTFGLDVLECPKCKGRLKHLVLVTDDRSIARYLKRIGEPKQAPARAPPRGPPYWASTVLRRKTLADIDMTSSAAFDS